MPTTALALLPASTNDYSLQNLAALLALDDDELLVVVKAHLTSPEALDLLLPGDIDLASPENVARIAAFVAVLRESTQRASGKQLAALLRLSLSDGGRNDVCDWYCRQREQFKQSIDDASGRLRRFSTVNAIAQLLEKLSEHVDPETLKNITDVLTLLIDFADLTFPVRLPLSIALFSVKYALDELCDNCDAFGAP